MSLTQVALALFALSSFGSVSIAEIKLFSHWNPLPKSRLKRRRDCADFTGSWKGKCTGENGSSGPLSTTFHQIGCEILEEGGAQFLIGGLNTSTSILVNPDTDPSYDQKLSLTATDAFEWNKEKTQLIVKSQSMFRDINAGTSYAAEKNLLLKIADGRLRIVGTHHGSKMDCELEKLR